MLLVLLLASVTVYSQIRTESPNGFWPTDGYGEAIEINGDVLRIYEITALSCISAGENLHKTGVGAANEIVFSENDDTVRLSAGISPDTRWFHDDGSVSNVLLRRTYSLPKPCRQPPVDTPIMNYRVFWETFEENYPFFALRKMNWLAVDKQFRPQVTQSTKPEELFGILSNMIEPLHDAHTNVRAKSIKRQFEGYRPTDDPRQKKNVARIGEIIETKYIKGGLRDYCNKQLQFGMLANSIGYLRVHSFARYSSDSEFVKQLDALESALDDIFKNSNRLTGLVIDVRINPGGSDVFGISIASRLASQNYLAYSKVARNNIHDPNHRTAPQRIIVHVSKRPSFHGPVALLTGPDSNSGGSGIKVALSP